jgi:hypothetical protein
MREFFISYFIDLPALEAQDARHSMPTNRDRQRSIACADQPVLAERRPMTERDNCRRRAHDDAWRHNPTQKGPWPCSLADVRFLEASAVEQSAVILSGQKQSRFGFIVFVQGSDD